MKGFFFTLVKEGRDFVEDYFKSNENLPRSEFCKKMEDLSEKILREKAKELRNDSKIISAFSGKEETLNRVIDYTISATIFEARNNFYFS